MSSTFDPRDYGALCNGQSVSDAAMTSGANVISSVSGLFAPGDVGKAVWVTYPAGAVLVLSQTTITGYISPTQVSTLGTALASRSSCFCVWGADDTAAFLAAFNAAVATKKGAQILVPCAKSLISSQFYN